MTVLERLGAHFVEGYRRLASPVREAVRLHISDTVGAWVAAGGIAEGRALLHFKPEWNPGEEGLLGRVALGCALARLSEIDDIHLSSGTTPGAIVVPAALAVAGARGSEGSALAEAVTVGYEAMTRLGAALKGPTILYRGIWPSYFAAPFAAAAVAARLLELDGRQTSHALAISLAHSAPSVGRQSGASMSRWLAIGNAARNGVAAALAAQAGFTGDLGLFEGDFFPGVYQILPDLDALVGGSERSPAVTQTGFKPWCAARQTMAAVQALKEIINEGVSPSEITELVAAVPPLFVKMVDHGVVPGERSSHLTSLPYQLALSALDPRAALDLEPGEVTAEIAGFMKRISVSADEELLRHYPRAWPARLAVATPAGKRERLVIHVPGDPERPLEEAQLAAKFLLLTTPIVGERAADRLLQRSLAATEEGPAALLEGIDGASTVA